MPLGSRAREDDEAAFSIPRSRWKKLWNGVDVGVRGMEGGRRREGSRTTREKPPRPCDGGREGCEAKSGRIGWPERVAAKVVVKGDPRVAGRRETGGGRREGERGGDGGTPCWKRVGSPAR